MAVVQCIDVKKHKTFGDIAADYYIDLVCRFTFADTFVYIFDRYDIQKPQSSQQKEKASAKVFQVVEGRTIP